MRLHTLRILVGNTYHAQVGLADSSGLSPVELEAIAQFGEIVVDVGGAFSGSATRPGDADPTAVSFSLATQERRFPSEFPAKQLFSLDDYADADVRAKVWCDTLEARLTSARAALLANAANFVSDNITTITG